HELVGQNPGAGSCLFPACVGALCHLDWVFDCRVNNILTKDNLTSFAKTCGTLSGGDLATYQKPFRLKSGIAGLAHNKIMHNPATCHLNPQRRLAVACRLSKRFVYRPH
ncbi:hypothetical protein, partial [Azotobacter salinestris]